MITSAELATLSIRRIIFHDVPNGFREDARPVLSETESRHDTIRTSLMRTRLTQVLGSKSAYPVVFSPSAASPVPAAIRSYTGGDRLAPAFVTASQSMATFLFDQQKGSVSPGLLCVLDIQS